MRFEGKKTHRVHLTPDVRRRILAENYRQRLQAYMAELQMFPENHQDVLKNAGWLIARLDLR